MEEEIREVTAVTLVALSVLAGYMAAVQLLAVAFHDPFRALLLVSAAASVVAYVIFLRRPYSLLYSFLVCAMASWTALSLILCS